MLRRELFCKRLFCLVPFRDSRDPKRPEGKGRFVALFGLPVIMAVALSAQTVSPQVQSLPPSRMRAGVVPPANDPEVTYMFLLHHRTLMEEVKRFPLEKSSSALETEKAAAASMNVSVADFRAIAAVDAQVEALLQPIDKEADAYRDKVISGAVAHDRAVIQQFTARRAAVKASIKSRLKVTLSPEGWSEISAYIDGPFRQTVRMLRSPQ